MNIDCRCRRPRRSPQPLCAAAPRPGAVAQDSVVLGMVLEPTPGLDPTTAPAAAIGEIVHYNVLEGLTKINVDGTVTPLLAESWTHRPRRQELHLQAAQGRQVPGRRGLRRRGGEVQLRARQGRRARPTRPRRRCSTTSASIATPDPHTVILVLNNADGDFPFRLGENTAVILDPKSAADARRPSRSAPARSSFDELEEGLVDHAGQVGRLPQRRGGQAAAR